MRRPDQVHREETPPESKPRQNGSRLCPWNEVPGTYLLQDWRGIKVACPSQEFAQTESKAKDADGQAGATGWDMNAGRSRYTKSYADGCHTSSMQI